MVDGFKFYEDLPRIDSFNLLTDAANYTTLPADGLVGNSDIVGLTKGIAAGKYKTVSVIGAVVISAQINAPLTIQRPISKMYQVTRIFVNLMTV